MSQQITDVKKNIKTVIKGKDEIIDKVLMAILAQGNVLLEDVPGVGKTTMALAFAKTMGLDTKRVQFTPDTMPSDVIGFSVYNKETGGLDYKDGAIMTNLLLADEINRTSSKTQAALLEAMEEKKVTIDGITHMLPKPFIVLATQNPAGSAGTQMLPNSQLDRFIIKLSMGYPDLESQIDILEERHLANPLESLSPVTDMEQLNKMIKETNECNMERIVYEYVAHLVQKTREHSMVTLGVSPRGALALCRMAKAHSYVSGRNYVTPEDVQQCFADVCAHRLVLNAKAKLNEYTAKEILEEILQEVKAPVVKNIEINI